MTEQITLLLSTPVVDFILLNFESYKPDPLSLHRLAAEEIRKNRRSIEEITLLGCERTYSYITVCKSTLELIIEWEALMIKSITGVSK